MKSKFYNPPIPPFKKGGLGGIFFSLLTAPCSLLLFLLSSCGPPYLISLPSLSQKLPKVVEVEPAFGAEVEQSAAVKLKFSVPVEPASINKGTLLIVEELEYDAPSKISSQISKGELNGIDGTYSISDDGTLVIFTPSSELIDGKTYGIVASTFIKSYENFSLPSTFVSKFIVKENAEDEGEKSGAKGDGTGEEASNETSDEADDETVIESELEAIAVVINELFYDAVGSDENAGLFVELAGEAGTVIGEFEIAFVNGDDGKITETIKLPSSAKIGSSGLYVVASDKSITADYVTSFDPQNGPDAVQLFNKEKNLLDAVCYGEVQTKTAENGFKMCEGEPVTDTTGGTSISRDSNSTDTDDNSKDILAEQIPTPNEK